MESVAIVTAGNRTDDSIAIYKVVEATGELENVAARIIEVGITETYGSCMYYSSVNHRYYVIINDKDGDVEQWELFHSGGMVDATMVRSFSVGSQTEGCVADDEAGYLYIGEENVGIWRYEAEPYAGTARVLVDSVGGGHLDADVEGLTIYYTSQNSGYLIASSQGNDTYVIYKRKSSNDYIGTFEIIDCGGVDRTSSTDGIDVSNATLGAVFPQGLFIAHDDRNSGDNENFKLVPWEHIAEGADPPLSIDTAWNPREVGGEWVSVEGQAPPPARLRLSRGQPNPFRTSTRFTMTLDRTEHVIVRVLDPLGRQVGLLHDRPLPRGREHAFVFDGAGLPDGLYLVYAQGETFEAIRKIILVR